MTSPGRQPGSAPRRRPFGERAALEDPRPGGPGLAGPQPRPAGLPQQQDLGQSEATPEQHEPPVQVQDVLGPRETQPAFALADDPKMGRRVHDDFWASQN